MGSLFTGSRFFLRAGIGLVVLNVLAGFALAAADPADGEQTVTPNEQHRAVKVNQDLPADMTDKPGDSIRVSTLRSELRAAMADYRKAGEEFGSGTPQSRAAAHKLLECQTALHKQLIREEATPAVAGQ